MDITKDSQSMTTFRNHLAEIMRHLKDTKRPAILIVNGKAAAVVRDAEAYEHLLDFAAEASAAEGIRQGLEDLRKGHTREAGAVFGEIREDHGISRWPVGAGSTTRSVPRLGTGSSNFRRRFFDDIPAK